MRFQLCFDKIEIHVYIHHDDEEALKRLKAAGKNLGKQVDELKDAVDTGKEKPSSK